MPILHICNTQFESELERQASLPLIETFEKNAVFLQLQFLPFLYADAQDGVAVTHAPPEDFWRGLEELKISLPKLHLLSEQSFSCARVESWGASRGVAAWAEARKLAYRMPAWEVVQQVNSKLFSFTHAPKLPDAALLQSEKEVLAWLQADARTKVLKTYFGVSGRGHFLWDPAQPLERPLLEKFLTKEFRAGRPVIGEPWMQRSLDFSTQWKIDADIHYLGATICESNERGQHRQNFAGAEQSLMREARSFLQEHKETAFPILQKMKTLGYFGHVGVDAMLYQEKRGSGEYMLHPVVEINARKTMGWAALEIQRRHFPNQIIALQYVPHTESDQNLLPASLISANGKQILFRRSLKLFTFNDSYR